MSFINKLKQFWIKIFSAQPKVTVVSANDLTTRMDRMERNYIILLKRVLELDGVQLNTKINAFTSKILRTPNDELNKALNEPEPTIH